jgi:hypothetical protein
LVRAFALDVTVDSGTIDSYSAAHASYNIYPGSIVIDAGGTVTDYGSPIADSSYPGTLGGLTTSGVTIEMGSLYASGDPTPPKSGDLITLTVSGPCNVSITENVIRGGIVMEDPAVPANPSFTGCVVVGGGCACLGDMNDDGWLSPADVSAIVNILIPAAADYYWVEDTSGVSCGDMNGDGWLSPSDASALVNILIPAAGDYYWVQCQ